MADQQVRPGMLVDEGPIAFIAHLVQNGDQTRIVLHFEHRTGASTFPLLPELAEQFAENVLQLARQAQGKPTGRLQIATPDQLRGL